jgi:hypothetical protein
VVHKLTGATSFFGPDPYYSVVCSSQFPVLLNYNNALDNDAVLTSNIEKHNLIQQTALLPT